MAGSEDTLARAGAVLDRVSDQRRRGIGRDRRVRDIGKRVARVALADAAVIVAAIVIGLTIGPIGIMGAFALMIVLVAVSIAVALLPTERAPTPERLATVELKALPAQTHRWLEAQRPALPAPAIGLVDQIGLRLDQLTPQLAMLDDNEPAAAEVRKLVGEQLPEFLKGYARVPPNLRTTPRNGKTPDAELVDGLQLIEREIGAMSRELAQGDLDGLATRGRYLEIKYRGDEGTT